MRPIATKGFQLNASDLEITTIGRRSPGLNAATPGNGVLLSMSAALAAMTTIPIVERRLPNLVTRGRNDSKPPTPNSQNLENGE